MTHLQFVRATKISLRGDPRFNERWLQELIVDDPAILGLGDLTVIDRERRQENAGRLDLLLADAEQDRRFELELQLGPTDESHIIRCIEYWDIERRRYPAYEHVAILVAEDVTGRFLSLLSVFAGTIPLVVLQCEALQVEQRITMTFVKVLDQRSLRRDDESEASGKPADREYWVRKGSEATVRTAGELLEIINEIAEPMRYEFNYNRGYISLQSNGVTDGFVRLRPKKKLLRLTIRVGEVEEWLTKAEEAEIEAAGPNNQGRLVLNILPADTEERREFLRHLLEAAHAESSV